MQVSSKVRTAVLRPGLLPGISPSPPPLVLGFGLVLRGYHGLSKVQDISADWWSSWCSW